MIVGRLLVPGPSGRGPEGFMGGGLRARWLFRSEGRSEGTRALITRPRSGLFSSRRAE